MSESEIDAKVNSHSMSQNIQRTSPVPSRGRSRRAIVAKASSGKYRQRHQTDQLLGGMESLTAIDIDLAESLVPTGHGTPTQSGRGRHANNCRKVNLSHLLNNRYDRQQTSRRTSNYGSSTQHHRPHNQHHHRDQSYNHKFNKQQFLQANCQFVVLSGADYTIHRVDPDWPVDWDCIEEVRFKQCASTETNCPICLDPPTAAKITKCGHIYCWTCMLHYLSLSDEKCRQCPICFEAIYKDDLRSVVSHSFINHSVDEDIVMRLMIRKKGCVEVEPYGNGTENLPKEPDPSIHLDHYSSRANLVVVSPMTAVTKIAQRERDELLEKLSTNGDQPEVCFIEQAMRLLSDRVSRLHEINNTDYTKTISSQCNDQEARSSQIAMLETSKSYLFYQSDDGQHIYLNPFSTKVLCHEFGSLENCPTEIRAKILQMDWISMNDGWRKRFRYLGHLPLTCEVRLIEIDLENSGLISAETFSLFADQVAQRKQERHRRSREERKREKLIQVQQNRKIYGIQPSLKISLDNMDQFPSVSNKNRVGQSRLSSVLSREDDEISLTDDEQSISQERSPLNCLDSQQVTSQPDSPQHDEDPELSRVTLSFREIQIQEAALEAKAAALLKARNQSTSGTSKWISSLPSTSRAGTVNDQRPSSSFAQLLTNAKLSKKEWTKNPNSGNASTQNKRDPAQGTSTGRYIRSSESDDGGEELRAPPLPELTIDEFMKLSAISSKKNKSKSKTKKK